MTDLTNRTVEEVNQLIQKYAPVLELSHAKSKEEIPILAIIYDISVKYIKDWHNNLTVDWKSWCVLVIKEQFHNKKIQSEADIVQTINDFIKYWSENYKTYCNNLGMYASEYDRDRGFVYKYLIEKNR
jgi:hypothetical protein